MGLWCSPKLSDLEAPPIWSPCCSPNFHSQSFLWSCPPQQSTVKGNLLLQYSILLHKYLWTPSKSHLFSVLGGSVKHDPKVAPGAASLWVSSPAAPRGVFLRSSLLPGAPPRLRHLPCFFMHPGRDLEHSIKGLVSSVWESRYIPKCCALFHLYSVNSLCSLALTFPNSHPWPHEHPLLILILWFEMRPPAFMGHWNPTNLLLLPHLQEALLDWTVAVLTTSLSPSSGFQALNLVHTWLGGSPVDSCRPVLNSPVSKEQLEPGGTAPFCAWRAGEWSLVSSDAQAQQKYGRPSATGEGELGRLSGSWVLLLSSKYP